jgi:hypothetical protein
MALLKEFLGSCVEAGYKFTVYGPLLLSLIFSLLNLSIQFVYSILLYLL